jgi:large subunit ribosomal protein L13
VVDAAGQTLGRLASRVAHLLRGKHKTTFVPHLDSGDYVIVLNAGKIAVSGDRMDTKLYRRHSQYPGGFKEQTLRQMMDKHPDRVIELAVKGMLPHNKLGRVMIKKLFVYSGDSHPHSAQKPETLDIEKVNVTEKITFPTKMADKPAALTRQTKASAGLSKAAAEVMAAAPAPVKKAKAPQKAAAPSASRDDLTRIEGIGPKVAQALYDSGVTTFAQLAELSGAELTRVVKEERGVRLVGDANTWPKQARFIVNGDEDGLKQYQDHLVGGREPETK